MKAIETSTTPAAGLEGIPEDADLPGLVAIRSAGVAAVLPKLDLNGAAVELTVRAHRPRRRMTLEMRAAGWYLPRETTMCLAHGTFHDENLLDCGDGPGVIDWESSGLGPPEVDAGTFLACMAWRAVRDRRFAQAGRATAAFRDRIDGRMDREALGWHEAAGLLCHAAGSVRRGHDDGLAKAWTLLRRAEQALSGGTLAASEGEVA